MKRLPNLYNSIEKENLLSLGTRQDKFGNLFYCVTYKKADSTEDYATFNHLSSALDYINSNFK